MLTRDETSFEALNYDPADVVLINKVYPDKQKARKKKLRSLRSRAGRRKKNDDSQSVMTDTFTDAGDADYNEFAGVYDDDNLEAPVPELPIIDELDEEEVETVEEAVGGTDTQEQQLVEAVEQDRKSTRLNSSH